MDHLYAVWIRETVFTVSYTQWKLEIPLGAQVAMGFLCSQLPPPSMAATLRFKGLNIQIQKLII